MLNIVKIALIERAFFDFLKKGVFWVKNRSIRFINVFYLGASQILCSLANIVSFLLFAMSWFWFRDAEDLITLGILTVAGIIILVLYYLLILLPIIKEKVNKVVFFITIILNFQICISFIGIFKWIATDFELSFSDIPSLYRTMSFSFAVINWLAVVVCLIFVLLYHFFGFGDSGHMGWLQARRLRKQIYAEVEKARSNAE